MTGILDDNGWAYQEFKRAQLGDQRLTERLVSLGEQTARTPAGAITAVFREGADREAAFRFVENDRFSYTDVALAAHTACAAGFAKSATSGLRMNASSESSQSGSTSVM